MTLADIRDFVRTHLDVDDDDLPNSLLDSFIREGSVRIERAEKRWPFYAESWTLDTVADTSEYTFASIGDGDVDQIQSIRSTNYTLEWLGRDESFRYYPPNTTASGEPRYWSVWGTTLKLHPTPDGVYSLAILGFRKPVDWVALGAAEEPDLPEDLHNTVATWALARGYSHQDDPEMAAFYMDLHAAELDQIRRRLVDTPAHQPLVLNGRADTSFTLGRPRYDWEV
jgi:hypothetical protein